MSNSRKIWYAYFTSDEYCDLPAFYNSEEFEWGTYIEQNYASINNEVQEVMSGNAFTPKNYFIEGLNESAEWKTYSFLTWGIKVKKALKNSVAIKQMIQENPQIVSVSINVLGPKSSIKPHFGDSNAFYRCHLGIQVPGELPDCGFKVNDVSRSWEKGKLLIFSDANKHEAWNNTGENRVILLFDVIKEEYMRKKFFICIRIRSFLVLQWLFEKYPWIKKRSKTFHRIVNFKIAFLLTLMYPYQKVVGVIKPHT